MCRGTSFYRRPDVALIMGRELDSKLKLPLFFSLLEKFKYAMKISYTTLESANGGP